MVKKIDNFSVFLDTVEQGRAQAKGGALADVPATKGATGAAGAAAKGAALPSGRLSDAASSVLRYLNDTTTHMAPSVKVAEDLQLGVLELAGAVDELVGSGLVTVAGFGPNEMLALSRTA
jgi:hypothetical protein